MTNTTPPPSNPPTPPTDVEARLKALETSRTVPQTPPVPPARPRVTPPTPRTGQKPPTREEELETWANELARENLLLKTAAHHGLTVEELSDLDYSTPTELELAAQVKKGEKESRALRESITATQKSLEELRQGQRPADEDGDESVDTGGRTRRVAREDKVKQLNDTAAKAGKTPQGRWAKLEALRLDPTKRIQETTSADEE